MTLRSEVLACLFGVFLVMVTFGDAHIGTPLTGTTIGNLDAIFGVALWPVLDLVYPLATVAVFLLYGWVQHERFKVNPLTAFLFISFMLVLFLVILDDVAAGLRLWVRFPQTYWVIVSWVYPLYSGGAFFLFGRAHRKLDGKKA